MCFLKAWPYLFLACFLKAWPYLFLGDSQAKQRRWLEKWTPFYPGGAAAAVMFEVTPRRIEIVDVAGGIVGDPQTWAPPSVDIKPQ